MRYAGIIENDIADSIAGIAVGFFVQYCPHHCLGCQDPETWDRYGGKDLPPDYLDRIEKALTANGIERNLSILGGEPLCGENLPLVKEIVSFVRRRHPSIKILIWTGYLWEDLIKREDVLQVLRQADLLIDGPFDLRCRDITLLLRGSRNQRIIDLKKTFQKKRLTICPLGKR